MSVTIYTDGGADPNPGPGGWGAVILASEQADSPMRELAGSADETTNNRMEITAALEALRALEDDCEVTLVTDSTYLKNGITHWLASWRANGWKTKEKEDVKNRDLWEALDEQVQRHRVEWRWTKGHAGDRWNERADALATMQIRRTPLPTEDADAVHLFLGVTFSGKSECGGWGVVLRYREHSKERSGGDRSTSANRMHIQSALEGLLSLKRKLPVNIYTTSSYLRDGATKWIAGWRARAWFNRENKPVSHRDLWQALDAAHSEHEVTWHVVDPRSDSGVAEMAKAKSIAGEAAAALETSPPQNPTSSTPEDSASSSPEESAS